MVLKNQMLPVTILFSFRKAADSLPEMMLDAAVTAWMEGHVEAHERARRPPIALQRKSKKELSRGDKHFPSPPWPPHDTPLVHALVREAQRVFGAVPESAVAYAAALGWAAGLDDGETCKGCSFRGHEPALAQKVRTGRARLRLE